MRAGLKRAAAFADRFLPRSSGVVTLIYHRVGGATDSSVDLDPNEFEQQIAWLAAECRVVTLDDAVRAVRAGDRSIGGSVVVTFDDGTPDICEIAVPILARYSIPMTLYAETGPICSGSPNASGLAPVSWSALRDAVSTGLVSVESHTHTHRVLRRTDAAITADELDSSIETIGAEIGTMPRHFAYPKAELGSSLARVEVEKRFESAAIGGGRPMKVGGDVQRWLRTPVQRTDTFEMFQRKARGGMWLEGAARSSVARFRYWGFER